MIFQEMAGLTWFYISFVPLDFHEYHIQTTTGRWFHCCRPEGIPNRRPRIYVLACQSEHPIVHPLKTAAQLAEHCLCGRAKNRNDRNGNDDGNDGIENDDDDDDDDDDEDDDDDDDDDDDGGGGDGDDNGDMNDNVMIMMTIIRTSHNLSTPFILLLGGDWNPLSPQWLNRATADSMDFNHLRAVK